MKNLVYIGKKGGNTTSLPLSQKNWELWSISSLSPSCAHMSFSHMFFSAHMSFLSLDCTHMSFPSPSCVHLKFSYLSCAYK